MAVLDPELRHRVLAALGLVERKFNPSLHLHDPHSGKFVDMPETSLSFDDILASLDDLPSGPDVFYHGSWDRIDTIDREIFLTPSKRNALGYIEGHSGTVHAVRLDPTARIADEDDLWSAGEDVWDDVEEHFGYRPNTYELADDGKVRAVLAERGFAGAEFVDNPPAFLGGGGQHETTLVWDPAALKIVAAKDVPAVDRDAESTRAFNPNQLRDPHTGEWVDMPGGGLGKLVDKLKLAGRIDLTDGETLLASAHIPGNDSTGMDVPMALVRTPAGPRLRIGVIPEEDVPRWRAADRGGTVVLDPDGVKKLRAGLAEGLAEGHTHTVEYNRQADEIDGKIAALSRRRAALAQQTKGVKNEHGYDFVALPPELKRELDAIPSQIDVLERSYPEPDDHLFQRLVPGDWGSLVVEVWGVDDEQGGWRLNLHVRPDKTHPDHDPDDGGAEFGEPELRRLMAELDELLAAAVPAQERTAARAATRAFNPNQLRDPHTGEWVDMPGGAIRKTLKELIDGTGLMVDEWDLPEDDGIHVSLFSVGDITVSNDLPGRRGEPSPGREVAAYLDRDTAAGVADLIDRMITYRDEDYAAGIEGESQTDREHRLVDYDIVDGAEVVVGYNPDDTILIGWPKSGVEDPDPDEFRRDFDVWYMDESDATDLGDLLRDAADRDERDPEVVDTVSAGGTYDLERYDNHTFGFTMDGDTVDLTVNYPAMGALRDAIQQWRTDQPDQARVAGFGLGVTTNAEGVRQLTVTDRFTNEEATFAVDGLDGLDAVLEAIGQVLADAKYDGRDRWLEAAAAAPSRNGVSARSASRAHFDDDDLPDDDTEALLWALDMVAQSRQVETIRAFDAAKHPRNPKGSPGGGRFKSMAVRLAEAIQAHLDGDGKGDPLDGFDREQLRKAAKARGIELKRGEGRDSIAKKLLDSLGGGVGAGKAAPKAVKKPAAKRSAVRGRAALRAAPIALGITHFTRGVDDDLYQEIDSDALASYRVEDYTDINRWLRSGEDFSGSDHNWMIQTIDNAMGHSRLRSDVRVYRVVEDLDHFRGVDTAGSLVGYQFREDAYSSTTADPAVVEDFFGGTFVQGKGVMLRMRVPSGTGAVQLSDFAKTPVVHRDNTEEAELLLQRGLTYRIVGDQVIDGRRELDVEVVAA